MKKDLTTRGTQRKNASFSEDLYVEAYLLARQGMGYKEMAGVFGCETPTLERWRKDYPALQRSIDRGRAENGNGPITNGRRAAAGGEFRDFVYNRLPKHLRKVWRRINKCDEHPNMVQRVEALLEHHGETGRKHLFLYALFHYNFDASRALASVNVTPKRFEKWVLEDPEFGELYEGMERVKKDFVQGSLFGLVKAGSERAIIFANDRLNGDRGFGKQAKKVEITKTVTHAGTVRVLKAKDMTTDERRKWLELTRASKARELPAHDDAQGRGIHR